LRWKEISSVLISFLQSEVEFGGKYLDDGLRDSNDLLHDCVALKQRLDEDGYLLLRGLHQREQVLKARRAILDRAAEAGMLDLKAPRMDAVINPRGKPPSGVQRHLAKAPAYLALVESPAIIGFFERLLGGPVLTFDYKWMRLVGTGENTGCHYDIVYMGRGTQNLYTCWTPLGDLSIEQGPLAICVGSHRFDRIKETYGKSDIDRDLTAGLFSNDPVEIVDKFGGKWQTTNFRAGDVVVFGMYTMHASLTNTTNRYRVSSDTRYQLASDPVDERWIGPSPKAHVESEAQIAKVLSIEASRKKFGI
jgi:hypothetical protein